MKIMFVGSEATPFSKTGGLADVLGSLPKELAKLGEEVTVVLPKHKVTKSKYNDLLTTVCEFRVPVNKKNEYAGIQTLVMDDVRYYFIDNEYYFGYRDTFYGHYDDGERYGFFNNAIIKMMEKLNYYPDILHANDWQSGLLPYLLQQVYGEIEGYKDIKTIFTIHNIAYQGIFPKDLLPYLNINYSSLLEFGNMINFLKTGINTADFVTTVSETYAEEILYDYFAYGMNHILRERSNTLFGIINGIDYDNFNPKLDSKIFYNYSLYNYVKGKSENKQYLRNYFHLETNKRPMIGMVSRLTEAKGFDLVKEVIEELVRDGFVQFVLLGSGDGYLEDFFQYLRDKYPSNVGVYLGYNDEMARKIYAGVDMFLMPSRFEPCGLAQLISLSYGTIPIVRKTGGLKDTIIPFNQFTGEGLGFGFDNYEASDMLYVIQEAIRTYHDTKTWKMLVKRGMQQDFSWEQSAKKYMALYNKLKGE